MEPKIGVSEEGRRAVADALSGMLADTYTLYLKTQNFHWNVTGPHFKHYHEMFGEQYEELAEANDEIAERIRALGFRAPGSFKAFLALKGIDEAGDNLPDAGEMIRQLTADHESLSVRARKVLEAAQGVGDEVTGDMMIERMTAHDKTAWMLRASLTN